MWYRRVQDQAESSTFSCLVLPFELVRFETRFVGEAVSQTVLATKRCSSVRCRMMDKIVGWESQYRDVMISNHVPGSRTRSLGSTVTVPQTTKDYPS